MFFTLRTIVCLPDFNDGHITSYTVNRVGLSNTNASRLNLFRGVKWMENKDKAASFQQNKYSFVFGMSLVLVVWSTVCFFFLHVNKTPASIARWPFTSHHHHLLYIVCVFGCEIHIKIIEFWFRLKQTNAQQNGHFLIFSLVFRNASTMWANIIESTLHSDRFLKEEKNNWWNQFCARHQF